MGVRLFHGNGAGLGVGVGCGFGIGWGFGGAPIGFAGLGAGGGCGLGAGLGWGHGFALGAPYINLSPEFAESRTHRPNLLRRLVHLGRRLRTLHRGIPPAAP